MSLPAPLPGLVIRYNYLWAQDAARGREEGVKERPAVVVLAVDAPGSKAARVYVLAIRHSVPAKDVQAREVPAPVGRSAVLDAARAWVVLSEFNEFLWPGVDISLVPGRSPRTIAYGFLTAGFFGSLRDRWRKLDVSGKSRSVPRGG